MMTRTEAYDAGLYTFSPPPVCSARWDKQNWIEYVTFTVPTEPICDQCGKDMGYEWLLGPVCGKCCRANHHKALGK